MFKLSDIEEQITTAMNFISATKILSYISSLGLEGTCAFQEIAFVCVFETEQMIPGGGTKLSATQFRVIQVH